MVKERVVSFSVPHVVGTETQIRCQPRAGYYEREMEGRIGYYLGYVNVNGRDWAIVVWDGEDEPDLMKLESLEVQRTENTNWERIV